MEILTDLIFTGFKAIKLWYSEKNLGLIVAATSGLERQYFYFNCLNLVLILLKAGIFMWRKTREKKKVITR